MILLTYWTSLGRHKTVALLALRLNSLELLSAEVEVGLVEVPSATWQLLEMVVVQFVRVEKVSLAESATLKH